MEKKTRKLRELLKQEKELLYFILRLRRIEWLAFYLGIRNTILIDLNEKEIFECFMKDEKYIIYKIKEHEYSYFVSHYNEKYKWDKTKSSTYNLGLFLEYPLAAIEDFQNKLELHSFYCLDYKIFRISNKESLLAELANQSYKYISKANSSYLEATMDLIVRLELI